MEILNNKFEKDKSGNYVEAIFNFREDEWKCYLIWYLDNKMDNVTSLSWDNTVLKSYPDSHYDHILIKNIFKIRSDEISTFRGSEYSELYDALIAKGFPREIRLKPEKYINQLYLNDMSALDKFLKEEN